MLAISVDVQSGPNVIGPITLGEKCAGKRSAGNPHAAFDVAGAGNVTTGAGLRPTAKAVDGPPDPTVRAPALDPTEQRRNPHSAARRLRRATVLSKEGSRTDFIGEARAAAEGLLALCRQQRTGTRSASSFRDDCARSGAEWEGFQGKESRG